METDKIPKICKENGATWDANVIENFLEEILTKMIQFCKQNEKTLFRFTFHPVTRMISVKQVPREDTTLVERIGLVKSGRAGAGDFCCV